MWNMPTRILFIRILPWIGADIDFQKAGFPLSGTESFYSCLNMVFSEERP